MARRQPLSDGRRTRAGLYGSGGLCYLCSAVEERWWLFGMTAIATGRAADSAKGWRVALRYALGDVPQSELIRPRMIKRPVDEASSTLPLFDL